MNNYFDNKPRGKSRGGSDYYRENRRPVQGSGRGSVRGGGRGNSRRGRAPVPLLIVIDVLIAALILLIFYVTNYEMTAPTEGVDLPTPTPTEVVVVPSVTDNPDPTDSAVIVETPTPTIDPNDWRAKFADKFTSGEVEKTENSYKSANINITITKEVRNEVPYFIADIYVADLNYFKTAFAKKANVMGDRALTTIVAKENNAILAINGDHCVDNAGTVIRNGKLFRKPKSSLDVLLMNYDGSMQTLSPDQFDLEKTLAEGVYQVWSFGPMLLKEGQPMTDFNLPDTIGGKNPRTAVGYYEPGHYCFVQVGGRLSGYSLGCTIQELSQLFAELKCTVAYNMDGGQSSEIVFMDKMLNEQASRRSTNDIIYIGE